MAMTKKNPKKPIDLLLEKYKTKAAIGLVIGLTRGAVSAWGDFVPAEHAITFERISEGELKATDLVPPKAA